MVVAWCSVITGDGLTLIAGGSADGTAEAGVGAVPVDPIMNMFDFWYL